MTSYNKNMNMFQSEMHQHSQAYDLPWNENNIPAEFSEDHTNSRFLHNYKPKPHPTLHLPTHTLITTLCFIYKIRVH